MTVVLRIYFHGVVCGSPFILGFDFPQLSKSEILSSAAREGVKQCSGVGGFWHTCLQLPISLWPWRSPLMLWQAFVYDSCASLMYLEFDTDSFPALSWTSYDLQHSQSL